MRIALDCRDDLRARLVPSGLACRLEADAGRDRRARRPVGQRDIEVVESDGVAEVVGWKTGLMVPSVRHLLRARDLPDGRYFEQLTVTDLARARGCRVRISIGSFAVCSERRHISILLARRLERAAALRRNTDRSVTEICLSVGLSSVGSFTATFGRVYGTTPLAYRRSFPPALRLIRIPTCVAQAYGRPKNRTFGRSRIERRLLASRRPVGLNRAGRGGRAARRLARPPPAVRSPDRRSRRPPVRAGSRRRPRADARRRGGLCAPGINRSGMTRGLKKPRPAASCCLEQASIPSMCSASGMP
jgi:AraC-like DNA-binding protein